MTAPPLTEPVLELWHPVRPRPKGSKKSYGPGRMVESNPHTKPHLEALRDALIIARLQHPRRREFPLDCPLELHLALFFLPYKNTRPGDRPSTTKTGDSDKLERLVSDALTQANVIKDDARIVDVLKGSYYDQVAGTKLSVGPARDNEGIRLAGPWPGRNR